MCVCTSDGSRGHSFTLLRLRARLLNFPTIAVTVFGCDEHETN